MNVFAQNFAFESKEESNAYENEFYMGKMFDTIYQDCFAINVIDGVVKSVLPVMSRHLPF